MLGLRRFLLFLLVLSPTFTAETQAQVTEYEYSATLLFTRGPNVEQFGTAVQGTVTIKYEAAPIILNDVSDYDKFGQYGQWRNPDATIDGVTNSGYMTGNTIDGGTTFLTIEDYFLIDDQYDSVQRGTVRNYISGNGWSKDILLSSRIYNNPDSDGLAELTDWNPLAGDEPIVIIRDWDIVTGTSEAFYSVDTFAPVPTTIIIGGFDTGVEDFEFEGVTITETIASFSTSSPSDGKFLSDVRKLTRELEKDGLITSDQQDAINSTAEQSVGK
ncbi:MAG: hypothetical protein HUJ26_05855 [Planctomycetaceae bacterium]|nr:hypothetical protein [Planctomycetaceae bacterium]